MTHLIYLIGRPGTGKYTISQELAKSGFVICDNQLINNPIFSLLNYDGFAEIPQFAWTAIKGIRKAVFNFLITEKNNSYVLTNNLCENAGDYQLFKQIETLAFKHGSLFIPVKLYIDEEEHLKRITQPTRRLRWKSIDPKDVYAEELMIHIRHPHLLELDVSYLTASQAAVQILEHLSKI